MTWEADFLSFGGLAGLMLMALWFSVVARTHFSQGSPRRPILFALEGLSLAICLGTIAVVSFGSRVAPSRSIGALALACAAGILFSSALRATRQRKFGVVFGGSVPSTIVEHGPYRYIRHPLYTAYMLNWIGCVVLSASVLIGAGSITVAILYILAARGEERDLLRSDLGPAYANYRDRTGLFLPRFWRSQ